ncbi:MAG TPA: cyclodeaminase/cyclohydrolase family protein [Synergistales bacterium]|nr:cyclodeaminase/cyclohydrolase family protein [Synergistales bacterium]
MGLSELGIRDFLKELSSDSPAPGGGSTAALCGALGSSLVAMVAELTLGNEKYSQSWSDMDGVRQETDVLSKSYLKLMEEDSLAFNTFMKALKLPKETSEEKEIRQVMMQRALTTAAEVPLSTLRDCETLSALSLEAVKKGNRNAITDALSASEIALSAGLCASYNVRINLAGIREEKFVRNTLRELKEILTRIEGNVKEARAVFESEMQ